MTDLSLQGIARALGGEVANNQVLAPGPRHSAKDRSMAVKLAPGSQDGFVVYSHTSDDPIDCKDYVRSKLGIPAFEPRSKVDPIGNMTSRSGERIVATYDYLNEHGELLKQAVRYEPKKFLQRRPDPDRTGNWLWKVAGTANVPYRLLEMIRHADAPVFIVEGEKDAERLAALSLVATTSIAGAGKWTADLNRYFTGRKIFVLADNDEPGEKHALDVAGHLAPIAAEVRVVRLPGLPDKGDVSDWLDAGGTAETLVKLCQATPIYGEAENVISGRFASAPLFDPWQRFVVPEFPLASLPLAVRGFVTEQADLIGCDPNALAMTTIASMSAALDHRFGLKLMRNGSWWASPRLWVLLAGDPSTKKTPALNAATRTLEAVQSEAYDAWEKAVVGHKAAGGTEEDEPPRPPRHVIGDITVEKLGEVLSRQPRGLLVKRDELSGWIGSMERYSGRGGGASDRAFWLQSFDGGAFTVDRIKGERHIKNLSVSLIGGIQPERLAEMHDLTTDGLLQRFIPVVLRKARFPVDAPAGRSVETFGRLIRHMVAAEPANLVMEDDAVAAFAELRRYLFDIEQASGGLAPGFQAFAGKLSGIAGSLALILHMAASPQFGQTRRVEISTIEAVRTIVTDFVLPHAFEFYRSAQSETNGDRLRRLASWLLTCGKDRIVPSDLMHNVAGFKGLGLNEITERLSPLIATGWLSPVATDGVPRAWKIEPAVRAQFAERRKEEDARKEALASLMGSPRKVRSAQ